MAGASQPARQQRAPRCQRIRVRAGDAQMGGDQNIPQSARHTSGGRAVRLAAATVAVLSLVVFPYPTIGRASGTFLPARQNAMAATDVATGTVVVFGGWTPAGHTTLGDTWTFDGTAWVQQNPATSPSARSMAVMSYDPDTRTVVLFGGQDASGANLNDTWTWNGTTWTQQKPATSPPTLASAAMTYDAVHHQLVLFGGQSQDSPLPADCDVQFAYCHETWTWDGTSWTHQTPTSFPCSRYDPDMAFDGATGNVVLFGGFNACGQGGGYLNDTWTWDGTNWTQQMPTSMPAYDANGGMDYDSARGVVTLVGAVSNSPTNDTWIWDGTNWTQLGPPASPPETQWMPVIRDDIHHVILQISGRLSNTSAVTGNLWKWDGTTWWSWDGTEWTTTAASALSVGVTGPASLTPDTTNHVYSPHSFTVTATLTNAGPQTATSPEMVLSPPTGFAIAATDKATHHLANLAANTSAQSTWQVTSPQADTVAPEGPSTFTVSADAQDAVSWVRGSYNITVPALYPPGAPSGVTATAGNGQVIISLTPPTTGLPITSYQVQPYAPDGVTPIGSPVTVAANSSTFSVPGLNNNCTTGRYRFAVSASNSLGPNPGAASAVTSSTIITAGHPSSPPASVAILVQGLTSSLPSDAAHEGYDPMAYSYCGLRDAHDGKISAYDIPAFLTQTATSFDPDPKDPAYNNQLANPTLTDLLALNGAVILPFSYRGGGLLGNAGDTPALYVNPYDPSEPAHTLRDAAADDLDLEVSSAHRIWPTASIVIIGHSNGGLVAETLFEKHAATIASNNVTHIYAVDSPINGVNDPGRFVDGLFNLSGGGAPSTSPALLEEYHQLWNDRQARDVQLIQQDQQMSNVFVPVGTYKDELYAAADSTVFQPGSTAEWHGIDSQVLCTAFTLNQDCQAQVPPDLFVTGNPQTGSILHHHIPSHSWVFTQQQWVNLLGNSVLPGGGAAAASSLSGARAASTTSTPSTDPTSSLAAPAASPGATITITGTNLGTSTGQVTFADPNGNRVQGTVTLWSPAQVQVVVPAGAATGEVYTITAGGDESFSGGLTVLGSANGVQSLSVVQTSSAPDGTPVSVTVAATETTGLPAPGVPVTPSSGLSTGSSVTTDANGQATIAVTDWGTTSLVFYSGTANTAMNLAWTAPTPTSIAVSVPSGPNIAGASAPVQATVTVGGQPAPAGTQVTFSVSGANSASLSATTAPTDSQGHATTSVSNALATTVQVTASAANASASATTTVSWLPTVTGLVPGSGPVAGGTLMTISGTGFAVPAKVYFGQAAAGNVTVVSSTTITATAPAAGTSGAIDVTVATAGGQSQTSSADLYTYTGSSSPPAVTSVSPTNGPAAGGTTVTVRGTWFSSGVTVQFGSTLGTNVVVVSSTQLTVTSPAGSSGTVDVTVTGSGGTSATGAPDQFTYT